MEDEVHYGEDVKPTLQLDNNVKIYGQEPISKKFAVEDIVEAHRWFQNGDHPQDNYKPPSIKEGELVRRYRHPYVSGNTTCSKCEYLMHDHGWIDCGEDGITVCPGNWVLTMKDGKYYVTTDKVYNIIKEEVPENLRIVSNHIKYINPEICSKNIEEGGVDFNITPHIIADLLNELLALDNEAITELFSRRVDCNEKIADHPTVQVRGYPDPNKTSLGLLGIINGFFESSAANIIPIYMEVDDNRIKKFTVDYRIARQ